MAIAAVLLVLVHAPRPLIALVLAQVAGLLVVLAITRFRKISIHCATAGGLLGVFLVLDAHTWPQVIAGSAIALLIGAGLYPLL